MKTTHRHRLLLASLLLGSASISTVRAGDELPPNLGRGLRPLVQWHNSQPATRTIEERRLALAAHVSKKPVPAQVNADGSVTVDVRLDGSVAPEEVKKSLSALGLTIFAEHQATHADKRDGMLSARLPLDKAVDAAKVPGVQSILVAHKPRPQAGKVPGQGLAALHADAVQSLGYTGAGVTVGVISDSFNVTSPHANLDVATGDLPAIVVNLGEGSTQEGNTDEGRAMLQIVHDVAPGARLVFSSTGDTQVTFENAIRKMRTNTTAPCNVVVDDVLFTDEPFFSDSIVAEAVDDVVTSTTIAGNRVIYYSAAGNDGSASYAATFTPITNTAARAGQGGANNLKLTQVPGSLTVGGFHNFKGGRPRPRKEDRPESDRLRRRRGDRLPMG